MMGKFDGDVDIKVGETDNGEVNVVLLNLNGLDGMWIGCARRREPKCTGSVIYYENILRLFIVNSLHAEDKRTHITYPCTYRTRGKVGGRFSLTPPYIWATPPR